MNEATEKPDTVSSPMTTGKQGDMLRTVSRLGPLEMEGIGLDQAILYSIECCGRKLLLSFDFRVKMLLTRKEKTRYNAQF